MYIVQDILLSIIDSKLSVQYYTQYRYIRIVMGICILYNIYYT